MPNKITKLNSEAIKEFHEYKQHPEFLLKLFEAGAISLRLFLQSLYPEMSQEDRDDEEELIRSEYEDYEDDLEIDEDLIIQE